MRERCSPPRSSISASTASPRPRRILPRRGSRCDSDPFLGRSPMRLASATIVAFATLLVSTTVRADPVPIRVGWVAPVANFASILLMKPELMHNQGKTYDLQPQHFASTPTMIPALAADQIDIGS